MNVEQAMQIAVVGAEVLADEVRRLRSELHVQRIRAELAERELDQQRIRAEAAESELDAYRRTERTDA